MSVGVLCKITLYEIDGKEVSERELAVESHWNDSELVVLRIGRKRYTVSADAIMQAISNATHTGDK